MKSSQALPGPQSAAQPLPGAGPDVSPAIDPTSQPVKTRPYGRVDVSPNIQPVVDYASSNANTGMDIFRSILKDKLGTDWWFYTVTATISARGLIEVATVVKDMKLGSVGTVVNNAVVSKKVKANAKSEA